MNVYSCRMIYYPVVLKISSAIQKSKGVFFMVNREIMEQRHSKRIESLLKDVDYARKDQNGEKVTYKGYAAAIGKKGEIDPSHDEHKLVSKKAVADLDEMILFQRKAASLMQTRHSALEENLADLTSTTLKKIKGQLPKSEAGLLKNEIKASKNALSEANEKILTMDNARSYIRGIKIR